MHAPGAAHLAQKEMATSVRMITSDVAISAPSNRTLSAKNVQVQKAEQGGRERGVPKVMISSGRRVRPSFASSRA